MWVLCRSRDPGKELYHIAYFELRNRLQAVGSVPQHAIGPE